MKNKIKLKERIMIIDKDGILHSANPCHYDKSEKFYGMQLVKIKEIMTLIQKNPTWWDLERECNK